MIPVNLWARLTSAWHVLLGRPLLYRINTSGLVLLSGVNVRVVGCRFAPRVSQ